jgi:hypothetical protein
MEEDLRWQQAGECTALGLLLECKSPRNHIPSPGGEHGAIRRNGFEWLRFPLVPIIIGAKLPFSLAPWLRMVEISGEKILFHAIILQSRTTQFCGDETPCFFLSSALQDLDNFMSRQSFKFNLNMVIS